MPFILCITTNQMSYSQQVIFSFVFHHVVLKLSRLPVVLSLTISQVNSSELLENHQDLQLLFLYLCNCIN